MHHMKLKAAVTKFGPLVATTSKEDLKTLIADPDNGYSEEEQAEVFRALFEAEGDQSNGNSAAPAPVKTSAIGIEIPDFQPSDLADPEKFRKYVEWLKSIPGNTKLQFDLMKVETIRQERYEGVKETPVDIVGIRIKDNKPYLSGTLIPVKNAVLHNGFIASGRNWFTLEGSQLADAGNTNKMFYIVRK